MKIEINEQKILTEILERDASLHQKIKETVERNLTEKITNDIENRFLKSNVWQGRTQDIEDRVIQNLEEKQTELVKKILKEFYDSYRYKKDNLQILKKLKEFIEEN